MKYPFSFKVLCYNSADKRHYIQCGMGICTNYAKATEILEKRYGNELLAIKHIELYEDDTVIIMKPKVLEDVVEYYCGNESYEEEITEEEANRI